MNRRTNTIIFILDSLLLALAAIPLTYFSLKYRLSEAVNIGNFYKHDLLLLVSTLPFQFAFGNYFNIWRHAAAKEYLLLIASALCGILVYEILARFVIFHATISLVLLAAIDGWWILAMLALRFVYRFLYARHSGQSVRTRIPVAVVGAGNAGCYLIDELQNTPESPYDVRCVFDDDPQKRNQRVSGAKIVGSIDEIPHLAPKYAIQQIIVAIPSLNGARGREVMNLLTHLENVKVSVMPSRLDLLQQKPSSAQLRPVEIDDLLGRDPITLDQSDISDLIADKTVLVTGGGGSIGSELCRQIAKRHPRRLVIVDIYENNAYDIQQELRREYGDSLDLVVEIASIRDSRRICQLFEHYRPQLVFHAAAHKHVPLMEDTPQEAVRNNVFGTLNVVQAADAYGVDKFIFISTDKAVNPTSVMGASKRMCEMILQSMKGHSQTCFAAVRFGNVLGSNGSVIPLFKRQIAAGGPVTITDKRIIRYFMTISEAVQLVLQAGAMAQQNELFVLDMGSPVKILDLAENLIRLSGLTPYQDIDIVEVGLRPGEKLYEELLVVNRDIGKTENEKIFVEHQPPITPDELNSYLTVLRDALDKNDPDAVREALHRVVPNYCEAAVLNERQGNVVKIPVN